MGLLFDRILTTAWYPSIKPDLWCEKSSWDEYCKKQISVYRGAAVFEISNVADYFYMGTSQEVWDSMQDFPRPMPPFPMTWLEWKTPRQSNKEGTIVETSSRFIGDKMGCFVQAVEVPANKRIRFGIVVSPHIFMRDNFVSVAPTFAFGLTHSWESVSFNPESTKHMLFSYPGIAKNPINDADKEDLVRIGQDCNAMMFPALLALSLLNCRNTVTREVHVDPRLLAKHAKRGHYVSRSHRIIEIQPVKTVLSKHGVTEIGYSRRAASIIRGHFKDYTAGAGLFGKYKGLFWWDQHVTAGDSISSREYRLKKSHGEVDEAFKSQQQKV